MKTGKITAKLRDAVPVCLMVNGEEVKLLRGQQWILLLSSLYSVKRIDIRLSLV